MDSNLSETAKSLANVAEKAANLLHKLTAPVFEQTGLLLGERMKAHRERKLNETLEKADRLLRGAGVEPNPVPPKLLLPIIDGCSIEDNETLQDMWAGLLATASQEAGSVSPSFAETLRQMTPDEARCIDEIYGNRTDPNTSHLSLDEQLGFGNFKDRTGALRIDWIETHERLGIIRREYSLTKEGEETHVGSLLRFSKYGEAFLRACRGPRKTDGPKEGRSIRKP